VTEVECRRIVNARSGGLCERCGKWGGTTLHHRRKRSQGGGWTPVNCVALCGHGTSGCHGWVEEHPKLAEVDGWHVRPWQQPGKVLYRGAWATLSDDGTVTYEQQLS